MRYVIGIDGGGTKTHLAAFNEKMELLGECFGGSSGLTSNSADTVRDNLSSLMNDFFTESGLLPEDCVRLCLGTSGGGRDSARKELTAILSGIMGHDRITVTDDASGALSGGSETGCGVLLVAGTGSICSAKNSGGVTSRAGGWGHIASDEGSGYFAACRILRAVFRQIDGRGKATVLTQMVFDRLGVSGADELVDWLYRSGKGKSDIASLAALCDRACESGDETAYEIIDECARGLAEMVVTAGRIFDAAGESVPCVYTGSFITKSGPLKKRLCEYLEESAPWLRLTAPLHNAAWGCARLAWIDSGMRFGA